MRAQVVARPLELVLGAAMRGAGVRLLLLRDGHAAQCNRHQRGCPAPGLVEAQLRKLGPPGVDRLLVGVLRSPPRPASRHRSGTGQGSPPGTRARWAAPGPARPAPRPADPGPGAGGRARSTPRHHRAAIPPGHRSQTRARRGPRQRIHGPVTVTVNLRRSEFRRAWSARHPARPARRTAPPSTSRRPATAARCPPTGRADDPRRSFR